MENAPRSPSQAEEDPPPPPATKGGWKAIKYILGNESFEKLASMSLIFNITLYLQTKYNMGGVSVVNVVNIWSGSSNVASLAGALVSDVYLGRFLTLLLGSIASFLGMATMTLTAGIPNLRPSACQGQPSCPGPQAWQLAFLFAGLGLLAIGAGGIRPCNIAFGADQFDTSTEKGKKQLASFFNWWYFSFTVALIIALTAVVYIQTNVSWVIGFAIPTACLAASIALFLIGRPFYICMKPQGSIFIDVIKVMVAACRKRQFNFGAGRQYPLYDPPLTASESSQATRLAHTHRFRFLDKAAIITDPSELDDQGMPKNGWKLCSLQKVEQLKCLVAIMPVWVSGIACFITTDQRGTFGILQANQMDRSIGSHFEVPPGWMNLTPMIALATWIFIYECVFIPQARKITKKDKRLTMQHRIMIGIVISILSMIVSGVVEKVRRDSASKHGSFTSPISIALLLPQFVLSGLTEAFAAVAILELLSTQMPESMRTVGGAIFFLSLSISSYISSLLVSIIHGATGKKGKSPWLGGHDLNKNRLDYYYYIIAGLGVVNLVYFSFCASNYVVNNKIDNGIAEVQLQSFTSSNGHSGNLYRLELRDEENV